MPRPFDKKPFPRPMSRPFSRDRDSMARAPLPNSRNQHVKKWPQIGEIVIARIDKVLDYGVFCSLLEYEGATGFVHISQVESAWIKNIRNHVKEGQMRAALVQKIDMEKLQIDLSLTKVSERQQRLRIEEYKQLERNKKLVDIMAKSLNKTLSEGWSAVADPLVTDYGSIPLAFEAIALDGASAAEGVV
ncbi:MAG: S1 RNA-binding domain-containing protein, partial [archaeon]